MSQAVQEYCEHFGDLEDLFEWREEDYFNVPLPEDMYKNNYEFLLKKYNNPREKVKKSLFKELQELQEEYLESTTRGFDNYTYLVPEVIAERIYETAFPHLVARQLYDLITFKGTTYTLQKGVEDSIVAFDMTEGVEIEEVAERVTEETVTPEKYGVRIEVTTEMIEDARINIFPRYVRLAGEALAKFENQKLYNVLVAGGTSFAGAIPITLVQILDMITAINANDWDADTIVVHPYQWRELMKTDEWRDAAGRFQATSSYVEQQLRGQQMKLWGVLNVLVSSKCTAGTVLIMDRKVAALIAQNRFITSRRYDDVLRDAEGWLATERLKGKVVWSDAIEVGTGFSTS